jgi:hypothetical protein
MAMKNGDVAQCGLCYNRRFEGLYHLHLQDGRNQRGWNNVSSPFELLVTANFSSSLILFILKMEATRSSETSVLTRPIWRHVPDDGMLHILDFI